MITEVGLSNCEIYEGKYSREVVEEQYRHLDDEVKCAMTTHRYGDIKRKRISPFILSTGISFSEVPFLSHSSKKYKSFR